MKKQKLKVMSVFGTRPEAIKMCPLVKELGKKPEIHSVVCLTGQHREMLDQVMQIFDVHADYDLQIMRPVPVLRRNGGGTTVSDPFVPGTGISSEGHRKDSGCPGF